MPPEVQPQSPDSRAPFIKEVANTIRKNHNAGTESFIFGISGKWGEGKTHFLNDLRTELQSGETPFEVFDINPWKYSSDNIAFLRNFLKTLSKNASPLTKECLKSLDFDTSKSDIHWERISWLVVVCAIGGALYSNSGIHEWVHSLTSVWKFIAISIGVPLFLAVAASTVTVQRSDRTTVTIDKFNEFLNKLLESFVGKKIVVFVDDLDRVTPDVARDVLDNLRTFFDRKELSFVVTGDHTVLERYLGKALLPDEETPGQLEEGRRFMKKIFNVYWRLPLPIESEVKRFVDSEFANRNETLSAAILDNLDRDIFKSYLERYFEKNYRQIIRFLDTVVFTFKIIQEKLRTASVPQKKYFDELTKNPLLVIRILMIQELCAPLFDKILENQQILSDLEYAVGKSDSNKVNEIINGYENDLSDGQRAFIKKFLYEEPRFYKNAILTVSDLRPFLFLAADASFGDQRGPSGDDFTTIATTGDPAQIKNALISMGEEKARAGIKQFNTHLNALTDPIVRAGNLRPLLVALGEIPPEYAAHKIFAEGMRDIDLAFFDSLPQEKMAIYNQFLHWIDAAGDDQIMSTYQNKFPLDVPSQMGLITVSNGLFTSRVIALALRTYYPQNPADALNRMESLYPQLNKEEVQKQIDEIKEALANDLVTDSNSDYRKKRLTIIKTYAPSGEKILREKVFDASSSLNTSLVNWAKDNGDGVWERSEIEAAILERLEKSKDFDELISVLRFIAENKICDGDKVWPRIPQNGFQWLTDNMPNIVNDQTLYQLIAPPDEYATRLMDILVEKIKSMPNADEQVRWLDYLRKEKWPWLKLSQGPSKKKFSPLVDSKNEPLEAAVKSMLDTWGGE